MKYTGELQKPVVERQLGLLASDADFEAEFGRQFDEIGAKLPELCSAHGIKYGDWLALVFALAREHVPGFKTQQRAGRKSEWHAFYRAELFVDVVSMIEANPKMSIKGALQAIQNLDRWREIAKPMTIGALRKQYDLADSRAINIVRDARTWDALPQDEKNQVLNAE